MGVVWEWGSHHWAPYDFYVPHGFPISQVFPHHNPIHFWDWNQWIFHGRSLIAWCFFFIQIFSVIQYEGFQKWGCLPQEFAGWIFFFPGTSHEQNGIIKRAAPRTCPMSSIRILRNDDNFFWHLISWCKINCQKFGWWKSLLMMNVKSSSPI